MSASCRAEVGWNGREEGEEAQADLGQHLELLRESFEMPLLFVCLVK